VLHGGAGGAHAFYGLLGASTAPLLERHKNTISARGCHG
jgi:hypothetical protein